MESYKYTAKNGDILYFNWDVTSLSINESVYNPYYLTGKHNENGPAVITKSGKQEWWINGVRLNDKERIIQIWKINKNKDL